MSLFKKTRIVQTNDMGKVEATRPPATSDPPAAAEAPPSKPAVDVLANATGALDGKGNEHAAAEKSTDDSRNDALMQIFNEAPVDDVGLRTLTSLVEPISAQQLLQELRALAQQVGIDKPEQA